MNVSRVTSLDLPCTWSVPRVKVVDEAAKSEEDGFLEEETL